MRTIRRTRHRRRVCLHTSRHTGTHAVRHVQNLARTSRKSPDRPRERTGRRRHWRHPGLVIRRRREPHRKRVHHAHRLRIRRASVRHRDLVRVAGTARRNRSGIGRFLDRKVGLGLACRLVGRRVVGFVRVIGSRRRHNGGRVCEITGQARGRQDREQERLDAASGQRSRGVGHSSRDRVIRASVRVDERGANRQLVTYHGSCYSCRPVVCHRQRVREILPRDIRPTWVSLHNRKIRDGRALDLCRSRGSERLARELRGETDHGRVLDQSFAGKARVYGDVKRDRREFALLQRSPNRRRPTTAGSRAELEPHGAAEKLRLIKVNGIGLHSRAAVGTRRDEERVGLVCRVRRNEIVQDYVGSGVISVGVVGDRDRVTKHVTRLDDASVDIRDRLLDGNLRCIEVDATRHHARVVVVAVRRHLDRRARRSVRDHVRGGEDVGVEPQLVLVVGRLRGDVRVAVGDRAVEKIIRGIGRVRELLEARTAVDVRVVARKAEVALVANEPDRCFHRSARRRCEAADWKRDGVGVDHRTKPVKNGQIAQGIRRGVIDHHERPTGAVVGAVLDGLHVSHRVDARAFRLHDRGDVLERLVRAHA